MVKKINHIAIIVDDIEKALLPYEKGLGLQATAIEYVESYNVRVCFLPIGDTQLELVEPLGEDGELVNFLQETGGGLHHLALEVGDVGEMIEHMNEVNILMQDKKPQQGANESLVAFTAKEEFAGVTVEFVELENKER